MNLDKPTLYKLYYEEGKTLQDIGDAHNITRERVRQLMEKHELPRLKRTPHRNRYKTLDEYFANYGKRQNDAATFVRLMEYTECAECKSTTSLIAHHIKYLKAIRFPAKSIEDIQVLCRPCHQLKHNQGMTYKKQLLLFNEYKEGATCDELIQRFNISRPLVYLIIRKIKRGHRTLRGS